MVQLAELLSERGGAGVERHRGGMQMPRAVQLRPASSAPPATAVAGAGTDGRSVVRSAVVIRRTSAANLVGLRERVLWPGRPEM